MIASISSCPKCNSLILEDTKLCPHCNHVLEEGAEHLAEVYSSTNDRYDGSGEAPCRECGADNRKGLVRCWQCGAFLKEEMEKLYQEMQLRPAPIITSEEVDDDPDSVHDIETFEDHSPPESGDDFELDDDFQMMEGSWEPEGGEISSFDDDEEEDDVPATATAEEAEDEADEDEELLKLAETEEREQSRQHVRRKKSSVKNTFMVQAPCGCKIRVQKYHQGQMGLCPKCKVPFVVPVLKQAEKKTAAKKEEAKAEPLADELTILDTLWHEIALKKFKPKVNALKGKGEKVDLVRWDDQILVVWPKQKGVKGNAAKQAETVRLNVAAHLKAGRPLVALPTDRHEAFSAEQLVSLKVIQPGGQEQFTTGIEVFGPGTITIQFPDVPALPAGAAHPSIAASKAKKKGKKPKKPTPPPEPPTRCVTLTLSQYRKFRGWIAELLNNADALQIEDIPLENKTLYYDCVLGEHTFEALDAPEWYQADEALPVVEVGWLCQCGEVAVCEEHRAEQKFGGKKPAGLAKTKCPKCEQNFGTNPLFHLKSVVAPEPEKPAEDAKAEEGSEKKSKGGLFGGLLKKKAPAESDEKASVQTADSESTAAGPTEEASSDEDVRPKKRGLFSRKPKDDQPAADPADPKVAKRAAKEEARAAARAAKEEAKAAKAAEKAAAKEAKARAAAEKKALRGRKTEADSGK
ncbi:hypothetical protein [Rubinisphaera margarita]|uniref:hypothetical protein n=1 Tax=Rubinisphaera margarita TaxID=2909586 RepID=UPI001EE84613|nr:hypothetical protein [Rubinisphaera margarita]MCG6155377.1 hypothetical protein [Rubinisphaera margarita]